VGGDLQELKSRHFGIMDALIAYPSKTNRELAEQLGYSEGRFSAITNSSLFRYALAEYRRRFQDDLREKIVEATLSAVKYSKEIVEDENTPTQLRQVSARDILMQGHAKAVEKSARLNVDFEIPAALLTNLDAIKKEFEIPFTPKKLFSKPEEQVEKDEA
jgi:DNA-binding MarR family transcriptional regulator